MRRVFGLLGVIILLAACSGGNTQEGVTLRSAAHEGATLTPDATAGGEPATGQLLLRVGGAFERFDLVTEKVIPFDRQGVSSPVVLTPDQTRGVFIMFPDFGMIDLVSGEIIEINNKGPNPSLVGISPDGQWLSTVAGNRLVLREIGSVESEDDPLEVASGSNLFYQWIWLADSRMLWVDVQTLNNWMLFDPATGESIPAGAGPFEVTESMLWGVPSPDGTLLARAVTFAQDNTTTAPGQVGCFDSSLVLYHLPVPIGVGDPLGGGIVWEMPGVLAASPQWLDDNRLLFVAISPGTCESALGDPFRQIMLLDLTTDDAPQVIAGPLGNATDRNDYLQQYGYQYGHLYSPSPDGRFVAWIGGEPVDGETRLNITEIATGTTEIVRRITEDDAVGGAADFLGHYVLRQVVWLK